MEPREPASRDLQSRRPAVQSAFASSPRQRGQRELLIQLFGQAPLLQRVAEVGKGITLRRFGEAAAFLHALNEASDDGVPWDHVGEAVTATANALGEPDASRLLQRFLDRGGSFDDIWLAASALKQFALETRPDEPHAEPAAAARPPEQDIEAELPAIYRDAFQPRSQAANVAKAQEQHASDRLLLQTGDSALTGLFTPGAEPKPSSASLLLRGVPLRTYAGKGSVGVLIDSEQAQMLLANSSDAHLSGRNLAMPHRFRQQPVPENELGTDVRGGFAPWARAYAELRRGEQREPRNPTNYNEVVGDFPKRCLIGFVFVANQAEAQSPDDATQLQALAGLRGRFADVAALNLPSFSYDESTGELRPLPG